MKSRIQWIDYVRAAAICCVVLCHATEGIYDLKLEQINEISASSRVFCFVCFTIGVERRILSGAGDTVFEDIAA